MIRAYPHFPGFKLQQPPDIEEKYRKPQLELRSRLDYDSVVYATKGKGEPGEEIPIYPMHFTRYQTEPGWAGLGSIMMLYTPDGVPLWGKRGPKVLFPGTWGFIGGHVDEGDSWLSSLLKELEEEAELTPADLAYLTPVCSAVWEDETGWRAVYTYFKAQLKEGSWPKVTEEMVEWQAIEVPENSVDRAVEFLNAVKPYLDET